MAPVNFILTAPDHTLSLPRVFGVVLSKMFEIIDIRFAVAMGYYRVERL